MNSVIFPQKLVTRIRRIKMVTMRDFPFDFAQSAKAEWSGRRYFVWRNAKPPTTIIKRSVKILDSGMPRIIGSATFVNHFSSISSAVKRMMKSPSHCMEGYFSSILAIHPEATTMRMIDMMRPIPRLMIFPWLAPATARTLSSDMATSAIIMVLIAALRVFASFHHSSLCSWARISR